MKVQLKTTPTTLIEATGETLQEVFEQVARLTEIFAAGPCGLCGGTAVKHVLREGIQAPLHLQRPILLRLHVHHHICRHHGPLAFDSTQTREGFATITTNPTNSVTKY